MSRCLLKLALKFSNDSSTKAQMIGASNNLYKKGDIIVGDNTDCIGLAKDINQNLGFDLYGKEILILEQEAQPKELHLDCKI